MLKNIMIELEKSNSRLNHTELTNSKMGHVKLVRRRKIKINFKVKNA
jgi:hypothetical protein